MPAVGSAKEGLPSVNGKGCNAFWEAPQAPVMHSVYLLESLAIPNQRYVGYTSDLKARFSHHNSGKNPSTAAHRLWNLAVYIGFPAERKAIAFER